MESVVNKNIKDFYKCIPVADHVVKKWPFQPQTSG